MVAYRMSESLEIWMDPLQTWTDYFPANFAHGVIGEHAEGSERLDEVAGIHGGLTLAGAPRGSRGGPTGDDVLTSAG